MQRRNFLTGTAALVGAGFLAPKSLATSGATARRFAANPFSLGIASGDPDAYYSHGLHLTVPGSDLWQERLAFRRRFLEQEQWVRDVVLAA